MKILIVRNDKIGDFMLAWPSFAMLKESLPESTLTALVPPYTKPLAEICPWIDDVIVDLGPRSDSGQKDLLLQVVRQGQYTNLITLISSTRIGWLGWRAGIPYRLAPATKFAQFFYNHRLTQRRSRSLKPEFEYNLDLIRYFLDQNQVPAQLPPPPYLRFSTSISRKTEETFRSRFTIPENDKLVFVHCGSGGSANNLSIEQYADLICQLKQKHLTPILTCGPGEESATERLASLLRARGIEHRLYKSDFGIVSFAEHLAIADLFIAGSTGPLHIAGALDVPTVGFFPSKRSSTPLRWRPLNSDGRHLSFSPPPGEKTENDMALIDIKKAAIDINQFVKKLYPDRHAFFGGCESTGPHI